MGLFDFAFNEDKMGYALIKRVTHGKHKGEYRFVLVADNNEIVATSELYESKQACLKTVENLFPGFEIKDKSK